MVAVQEILAADLTTACVSPSRWTGNALVARCETLCQQSVINAAFLKGGYTICPKCMRARFEGVPTRGIRFSATHVWDYTFEHDKLDRLRQLVDEGKITLRVAATYKPEAAPEAHRRLEARGTRGRIVIAF